MSKKLLLTLSCGLFLAAGVQAQLAMTRSTFTGAYNPISLPAATLSTASGDDVAESAIPIGFTFNYLGNNFTTIGVNTNGAASFDAVMPTSGTNINLFSTNGPNNTLAPWWDNIFSDTILYQLQGVSPNQTFTIQWTNSFSYSNTATQQLNFQVILYETSNIIEFSYGTLVPGIVAQNESASIGIEGATGGAGNYLDAVTGSAFTGNGMLEAALEWPSHNFRFTPGAPAAVAGGTYTVGVAGNYFSLSEAIADINHRGIAGPVVLSLIDAAYDVTPANGDNFFPMLLGPVAGTSSTNGLTITSASGTSTISSDGAFQGNCANAAANNIISNINEPVLALVGASYVTLQDIAISCSSTGIVDRGIQVINSSATVGSQNNLIQDVSVTLNRGSIGCYGISQQTITTPTGASGTNSLNRYLDLNISNVFSGIYLNGAAAFPDSACVIGTNSPMQFNSIGAATPDDLGGGVGATASFGIRANNQNGVHIFNNEVRNITNGGTGTAEGIIIDAGVGTSLVHTNKVHDIAFSGTGTTAVAGIRVSLANVAGAEARVYNNFVYGLASSYAGPATATRAVRGIYAQSAGGGNAASTIHVDFNNVMIDISSSPNLSATCFESGSIVPVINTRNNVFSNMTGAQTGIAGHYAMASTNATAIGGAGSVSDNNDLYINNAGNGYTGIGAAVTYATLANWQTAMTQDAASIAVDPGFFSTTNLHISAVGLDGTANATGIPWVTVDIDNQSRAVTPDIGADEFTPLLLDVSVTALVAPLDSGCHTATEPVIVTLKNYAIVPIDFTTDSVLVVVNITGAVTQTLSLMINDNSINGNVPLPTGATINVPVGTFNMTTSGLYTFDSYCVLAGDGNLINDTLSTVNINYSAGTVMASTASVCGGGSVILTLSGASPGGTIQWQSSTDGGTTWMNESGPGFDSTVYVAIPTDTTLYQVVFCGVTITNFVTVDYNTLVNPVVMNDTACGPGIVNLSVSGSGTINWYTDATGGSSVQTGTTYSPNVTATDTFYVTNTTGSATQGVGLYDNSAGGAMSGSNNNLIFDVLNNCTLTGVYVYPAAAGTLTIDLADDQNNVVNTATTTINAGDVNQRTFIPLNFNLTAATGMQLMRTGTSVQLWRNNAGVNYPYTIPGIISITGSTAGAGFYYFFYDWQISFGCESPRVPLEVTVLAPPAITLAAGDTVLCLGDSSALSVSSANAGYAYTWSPAGTLNSATGPAVIAGPSATTTYTVNADDAATGCRAIDSITIAVNVMPPFVATSTDSVLCTGATDTLLVSCGQSVGLSDNSAGGNMSASPNNLIFDVYANCTLKGVYVYPDAVGNVIIELQDNTNAVINTSTFVVSAGDVGQRTYVPLNFSLTPGTGMQLVRDAASVDCWRNNVGVNYPYTLPGTLSITTSTAGAGFYYFFYDWQICTEGAYAITWTSNPVGFTATGDSAFVMPTVTTQYIATITDTVAGCVMQDTTTITIATAPDVTITGPPSICMGDSALLTAGYTGGDGNISYVWSNSLGTNASVTVGPTVNTTYSVTATDGCGSVDVDSFTVVVTSGVPTAAFSYSPSGVNMFDYFDASTAATSWQWDFGDASGTSTAQNPTYTYASSGTYTVTLIVTNGCGADTITQVVFADAIDDVEQGSGVVMYPNPADEQFSIAFVAGTKGSTNIEIFGMDGKLLYSVKAGEQQKGSVIVIDAHAYAAGMYIVKITDENGASYSRMQIQ